MSEECIDKKFSRRQFLKLAAGTLGGLNSLATVSAVSDSIDDIIEETIKYKLGNTEVRAKLYKNKNLNSDITFFNMHKDEQVSIKASKGVVKEEGGRLIYLDHNGDRYIHFKVKGSDYRIDSNRIFTEKGIINTLNGPKKNMEEATKKVKEFRNWLLNVYSLDKSKVMVAVHNNTNGGYSIKSYLKGGRYEKEAKAAHQETVKDPDNFFFVTKEESFKHFKSKGYNVALQAEKPTDDGSLSVYWTVKNTGPYINVEVENNRSHKDKQKGMLLETHKHYHDYSRNKTEATATEGNSSSWELYTINKEDKSLGQILKNLFGETKWDLIPKITERNNKDDYYKKKYGTLFNPDRIVPGRQMYLPK